MWCGGCRQGVRECCDSLPSSLNLRTLYHQTEHQQWPAGILTLCIDWRVVDTEPIVLPRLACRHEYHITRPWLPYPSPLDNPSLLQFGKVCGHPAACINVVFLWFGFEWPSGNVEAHPERLVHKAHIKLPCGISLLPLQQIL